MEHVSVAVKGITGGMNEIFRAEEDDRQRKQAQVAGYSGYFSRATWQSKAI